MKGSLAKAARTFDALRIKLEAGAPAPVEAAVVEAPATAAPAAEETVVTEDAAPAAEAVAEVAAEATDAPVAEATETPAE